MSGKNLIEFEVVVIDIKRVATYNDTYDNLFEAISDTAEMIEEGGFAKIAKVVIENGQEVSNEDLLSFGHSCIPEGFTFDQIYNHTEVLKECKNNLYKGMGINDVKVIKSDESLPNILKEKEDVIYTYPMSTEYDRVTKTDPISIPKTEHEDDNWHNRWLDPREEESKEELSELLQASLNERKRDDNH